MPTKETTQSLANSELARLEEEKKDLLKQVARIERAQQLIKQFTADGTPYKELIETIALIEQA